MKSAEKKKMISTQCEGVCGFQTLTTFAQDRI